jgi:metal transporter CNNM
VRDAGRPPGLELARLVVRPEAPHDDVIDEDVILVWTPAEKRIITGSDVLGRLLRGIVLNPASPAR